MWVVLRVRFRKVVVTVARSPWGVERCGGMVVALIMANVGACLRIPVLVVRIRRPIVAQVVSLTFSLVLRVLVLSRHARTSALRRWL